VSSHQESSERDRYTARASRTSGDGDWPRHRVEILRDGRAIGSYPRNYGLMTSFHPFMGPDGGLYALYSSHYTATRVMSLPDCRDLGGEDQSSLGFCPVEYFVPYNPPLGLDGSFGFVAGCVWGDDSSWKVQFLDLSRVADGVLVRDDRFGYLELEDGVRLADAVDLREWNLSDRLVRIRAVHPFEIELPAGAPDSSVVRDDRPTDPSVSIPSIANPGSFDAFHAEFHDLSTNGSQLRSQDVASFATAWNIAMRWHVERRVDVNVRGRTYGQFGMAPGEPCWVSVAKVDRDGKVTVFR
jgi:hypothetical protein